MLKCKCNNCKQLFILPANYMEKTIKCSECGAMNRPIPIAEKHQGFSIFRLPTDKLIGYVQCRILGKQKWVIPIVVVFVLGISGLVYSVSRENPVWVEIRSRNTQASQMIFKNQPEEAMTIYDEILERLSHQKSNELTRQWTQRIKDAKTMTSAACEMKFIRKCQPEIVEAEALMKNGKDTEAVIILRQVCEELEKSPWKGKQTQMLLTKIQRIKQEGEGKSTQ